MLGENKQSFTVVFTEHALDREAQLQQLLDTWCIEQLGNTDIAHNKADEMFAAAKAVFYKGLVHIDAEEHARLAVFTYTREHHLDLELMTYKRYTGNNYEECKAFLQGGYDNKLNYPHVLINAVPVPVRSGHIIVKYNQTFHLL
jgi:hypothetical protein